MIFMVQRIYEENFSDSHGCFKFIWKDERNMLNIFFLFFEIQQFFWRQYSKKIIYFTTIRFWQFVLFKYWLITIDSMVLVSWAMTPSPTPHPTSLKGDKTYLSSIFFKKWLWEIRQFVIIQIEFSHFVTHFVCNCW